jgi:hypothetical protein
MNSFNIFNRVDIQVKTIEKWLKMLKNHLIISIISFKTIPAAIFKVLSLTTSKTG